MSVTMTSGLLWKYWNGSLFAISEGFETALPASTRFNLTRPLAHGQNPPWHVNGAGAGQAYYQLHPTVIALY